MPRCTNCQHKWKVKELLALGLSKNGKDCPNCKQKQYVSGETQKLFTLGWLSLLFIPIIVFQIKLSAKKENLFE